MAFQDELRAGRDRTGPPLPRHRRWDLLAAWGLIVLPALALAAAIGVRQRVTDLEERLVREANALVARTHPRPVHAGSAVPGAAADALAIHLPRVSAARGRLGDTDLARLRAVVAGDAPPGSLEPRITALITELGPELDGILAATHAERADLPDWPAFLEEPDLDTLRTAAPLAGFRVREALAAGLPERAVSAALDALALARDTAISRAMVGHMEGLALMRRLTPAAAAAITRLGSVEELRRTQAALRRIRAALPPFSATLRDEFVLTQLWMGGAMSEGALSALDPRARALVSTEPLPWAQRLLARDIWRDMRALQDEQLLAADLPEDERTAAWNAVEAHARQLVNPLVRVALVDYGKYARRGRAAEVQLDALVLAAAVRAHLLDTGRWPSSVAEVGGAGGLAEDEAERLGEVAMTELHGGLLELVVPLPQGYDKDPGALRLVLEGRTR